LIWPNVVIRERAVIGSRVILHPGAVIGADGFGYAKREGRYIKVRHVGIVVIEDDVEIGANATVDRGTMGQTWIKRGVKLDNLVHIAHNVEVGEDTVMAAQCGISGSTVIGNRVMMGGQVGMVDHLHIGDEALLIAQSGVIGDIPSRAKVSGYPARSHREVLRAQAEMRGLGRLRDRVKELEKQIARLLEEKDRS
jgi:UDP-3-O-[3-hydroxymyristoyl] glucosamine N-acyltransferase